MRAFVFGLLGSCLLAAPVLAQTTSDNGRYSMTPTQNGFLRLDTRTGGVALCRPVGESVECRAAPEERLALQSEIDRLARENEELKARVAGAPPAANAPPVAAPPSRTREEMDRALDYAERFMRRMMRIMRDEAPADRT